MRITKKDLQIRLEALAEVSGRSTSKEQAIANGHDKYLFLEHAACYGGYRLINVGVSNGAHYGAFGQSSVIGRISAREMYNKLYELQAGIEAKTVL